MNQPDNHIDELKKILFDDDIWPLYPEYDNLPEKFAKLDQYYADFYRNKIPEKKTIDTEHEYDQNTLNKGYNRAVNDITTQFNSKGNNDEL